MRGAGYLVSQKRSPGPLVTGTIIMAVGAQICDPAPTKSATPSDEYQG